MRRFPLLLLLLALVIPAAPAGIVSDTRALISAGRFPAAERLVRDYRSTHPADPAALEALSWLARASLDSGRLDAAGAIASETRNLSLQRLKTTPLASERSLQIALGASIEVQAAVSSRRGDRSGAVAFLNRELKTWWNTPLRTRIQKNLHLLSLAGKPAPPLDIAEWLGPKPPSLASLKGRPVLLFFWAHWCPDCKSQAPALARALAEFGPRGLAVIAPTQRYGYVARGEEANPHEEKAYIDTVRRQVYSALGNVPVPLSEENFRSYGASTVPTLVLIDREGVVRVYHPGEMSYEDLARELHAITAS